MNREETETEQTGTDDDTKQIQAQMVPRPS